MLILDNISSFYYVSIKKRRIIMAIFKVRADKFTEEVPATKENDVYSIHDWTRTPLKRLVASVTVLHPGKKTRGHRHQGVEEFYVFLKGAGFINVDEETVTVKSGDIIAIPDGAFHQVDNIRGDVDLVFFCVFERYEDEEIGRS